MRVFPVSVGSNPIVRRPAWPDLDRLLTGVCYVCPGTKYEFIAAGNARDTAPFFGIWFCGGLGTAGEGVKRAMKLVTKAQA